MYDNSKNHAVPFTLPTNQPETLSPSLQWGLNKAKTIFENIRQQSKCQTL